eukprot:scaffold305563_cov35-Tisochrysis_lutea.AAC.3
MDGGRNGKSSGNLSFPACAITQDTAAQSSGCRACNRVSHCRSVDSLTVVQPAFVRRIGRTLKHVVPFLRGATTRRQRGGGARGRIHLDGPPSPHQAL